MDVTTSARACCFLEPARGMEQRLDIFHDSCSCLLQRQSSNEMPNQAPATATGAGNGAAGQQGEAAAGFNWQSIARSAAMFFAMQAGE